MPIYIQLFMCPEFFSSQVFFSRVYLYHPFGTTSRENVVMKNQISDFAENLQVINTILFSEYFHFANYTTSMSAFQSCQNSILQAMVRAYENSQSFLGSI